MAFSDVIDLVNADQCLLVTIYPVDNEGGEPSEKLYLSERHISSVPLFAPGEGGSKRFSGVIESWGEFGYVASGVPPSLRVGDGSFLARNDKPFGPFGTFADLLVDYDLIGSRIWIGQMMTEVISGSEVKRSALIFSGVISGLGEMTRTTIEVFFTDLTAATAVIPSEEITRVGYPNAPDISIGTVMPIILGEFDEIANPYSPLLEEDLQEAGQSALNGVPAVITHEHLDTTNRGPDFRLCNHFCDSIDADHGALLMERELEVAGRIHPSDWTPYAVTPFTEIQTAWPLRVYLPVLPKELGYYMRCSNPINVVDGDLSTTATLNDSAGTSYVETISRSVSQLGAIVGLEARAWLKAGGSGSVVIGARKKASAFGGAPQTTTVPISGNEQIVSHAVTFATGVAWPTDGWNLSEYSVQLEVTGGGVGVRQVWWVVLYQPNRRPDGPTKRIPHQYGDYTVYRTIPVKDTAWADKNPTVIGNVDGTEDDGSGTYTGTPNALIKNGARQIHYLMGEHSGLSSSDLETGTGIGAFGQARAQLGIHHNLSTYIKEREELGRHIERLCAECRAMPVWNNSGKFGIVVIEPDPSVDYRASHASYDFEPDRDFFPDTFKVWRTPLDTLVSRVYVDFDYCHATGKFRKTTFITPDGTDNGFGTDDDSGRETLAGYSQDRFGIGREFRLQAFDVRKQGVAKSLRNFYFDNLWRPRTWFEFQTGINVSDMSVGNVMRFGVETIQGMRVPNADAADENWDDYHWYVSGVTRLEQSGDVSRYLVQAFEAIIPTVAADWQAAEDDT